MNNKTIVVLGSSNTDMVIKSPKLPLPGETIIGGAFFMNQGGKGANQAVAAARMGADVQFISKIGTDIFGKQSIKGYKDEGINVDKIFIDESAPSGIALISVDGVGENSILVAPGANSNLLPADLDKVIEEIKQAGILLMQLEIPMASIEYAAEAAFNNNVKVILNPAPAGKLSRKLIDCLFLIVVNESEAEYVSGVSVSDEATAIEAAKKISDMGVKNIIVTLGSDGVIAMIDREVFKVPAIKVEAIDTTAAGDTFCGVLSVGIMEGMPVIEAIKLANKAAALSVTRMGAQKSIPYRNEFE
ncbi:ribokinase [Polluticaenibacter yanchengensis]|uniref:Ribokinase n=1 Tax=Polluticaenibacter yanchengensis TaxID=3014562 RepID=A0ABT4UEQ0_9BACT|nr:ribokinase [Chitinophagaceae bacterium LY-5]